MMRGSDRVGWQGGRCNAFLVKRDYAAAVTAWLTRYYFGHRDGIEVLAPGLSTPSPNELNEQRPTQYV